MNKLFCDICKKEITDIIGAGKLAYFERVSKLGEKGSLEQRVNRVDLDICAKCNEDILKVVQKHKN